MKHPFDWGPSRALEALAGRSLDALVDHDIRQRVQEMGLRHSPYGYDAWGVSATAAARALAIARWFYRSYFRVESTGVENIPAGRVLLIANHSGQLPIDGVLIAAAVALEGRPPRHVHAMIERFFAGVPFLNTLMQRVGQTIGLPAHCERLLQSDEAVLVFPEGVRGSGKTVFHRYQLMGFGQGFMRLAMRTNTPIVPVGFVGGEEMAISFSRLLPLARVLGLPYLPLSPTLTLPMPVRCNITFGRPLLFEGTGNETDDVVLAHVNSVEEAIAELLQEGRSRRASIWD
ncbi:MAG: lysophospholipid acyltransferase family protein [Myxococcota bacterium]